MNIIVFGCGRVGSELAYRLYRQGHQVTVIDQTASAFSNLHPDFRGRKVEGELLSEEILHRAGIQEADAVAAMTNSDSFNVVVAHLARTTYRISRVVARNFDPRWLPLHEAFGLQVVSSSLWAAEQTEYLLCDLPWRSVLSAGVGEVQIYLLTVPSAWQGRALTDLIPGGEALPVALVRKGCATLPGQGTQLEAGDLLYLSTTSQGLELLKRSFNTERGE